MPGIGGETEKPSRDHHTILSLATADTVTIPWLPGQKEGVELLDPSVEVTGRSQSHQRPGL